MCYTVAETGGQDCSRIIECEKTADYNRFIGYTLGAALKAAEETGYHIEKISITAPPKLEISEYDNSFRVIRVQCTGNNKLSILVCKPL